MRTRTQRHLSYLGKAIGMGSQNGHIAGLRIGVVEGDVLFHGQIQGLFLIVGRRAGILADVLARHYMLDDAKW